MKQNDLKQFDDGNPSVAKEDEMPGRNQPMPRRTFMGKVGKIVAAGTFAHILLLSNKAFGSTTCPGGASPSDICVDGTADPDECPGGMAPEDVCPADGNAAADICVSGHSSEDICDESTGGNSDSCPHQSTTDDVCDGSTNSSDACTTGLAQDDYCSPTGGTGDGDSCWGGAATVNGQEMDTCEGGTGDQCNRGGDGDMEDDCKPTVEPDVCNLIDSDTCWSGTNSDGMGENGGDDWCSADPLWAGDACWDGSTEQDLCIGQLGNVDACPDGQTANDLCQPTRYAESPDVCVRDFTNSDECNWMDGDEDYCPGGGSADDKCGGWGTLTPEPDDCPGGLPAEDVCESTGDPDECPPGVCGADEEE